MSLDDIKNIRAIVRSLLLLIDNDRQLAVCIARNQGTPKYLQEQSQDFREHINDLLNQL